VTEQQTTSVADAGDYLKAFACTAVMLQTVLSWAITTPAGRSIQVGLAGVYLAVKFTAPAFICGILFTTIRTTDVMQPTYGQYLRQQWSALGVPTVWWSLAYLLLQPQLQQHHPYTSLGQFAWQLINGNAAPHLWYNTMMLQIILLMPLWWAIRRQVTTRRRFWWTAGLSGAWMFGWVVSYHQLITPAARVGHWYLLDRVFWGFALYAVLGILLWLAWSHIWQWRWTWVPLLVGALATLVWQVHDLLATGRPITLARSSYYAPATVFYGLCVIGLLVSLAAWQQRQRARGLVVIHWLATYAYRAYLANVFWLALIWRFGGQTLTAAHPVSGILVSYLLTWAWSFATAYGIHRIWQWMKGTVAK